MTERVIGPTGSPRRRWTLLFPLVVMIALGLFYVAGAQAVHDAGAFELDTPNANALDSADPGDDWDNICTDNPSTCTFKNPPGPGAPAGYSPPAGSSTATASSHEADVLFSGPDAGDESLAATIFHGSSKDPGDISTWRWKDDAGGLPAKDNLLHAYAARYTQDASEDCPNGPGPTFTGDCSLIYFGSDRYANDGDATQAFWFLQKKVTLDPNTSSNGGFEFDGVHQAGDILIISEFSNGGTKSTITVYKWNTSAPNNLQFLASQTNSDCDVVPDADPFCGVVNKGLQAVFSPWTFLDTAGSTNFRQGELFEAGINLSDPSINLEEECFSSFVAESRASTSVTSTLKDFVLGQFEVCAPGLTTQASTNDTDLSPGDTVTDRAIVQVTGATSPADPLGTVQFYLCGPIATGGCTSTSNPIGSAVTLSNAACDPASGGDTDGLRCAVSVTVNDSGQTGARGELAPGRYCFRAAATLTNYDSPAEYTDDTNECFAVAKTPTSISTAQSWLPQDSATISPAVAGSVVFSLYESADCSGDPLTTFSDNSAPFTTNNQTTVVYGTPGKTISWSATFTPTDTNTYLSSTTTMCEKSVLTIDNAASVFPPPSP